MRNSTIATGVRTRPSVRPDTCRAGSWPSTCLLSELPSSSAEASVTPHLAAPFPLLSKPQPQAQFLVQPGIAPEAGNFGPPHQPEGHLALSSPPDENLMDKETSWQFIKSRRALRSCGPTGIP